MSPDPGTSRPGIHEGTRLGHYLVERRLGSGGEATVLLARDVILRRKVALKILQGKEDEPSTIRGLNEARLIATLDHPNIVRVYHVERSHGVWFMAMEYIDGGNLAERVRRLGAMDPVRALRAALAVADALDHAHQIGVVHRDLKPQNLLVSRTGAIKLADFGLAAVACLQRAEGDLRPRSGPRVGTPQFAAPELWSGKPATPSSDLYSLGACLYFFLAARAPFTSDTLEGLGEEHLKKEPVPTEGVPVIVADLVLRCLAKDPADRPASARAMCDEIQARIAVLTSDRRRRRRSPSPPPRSAPSGAFGAAPSSHRLSGGWRGAWATADAALLALPRFAAARQWLSRALLGDAPLILFYGPEPHAHRLFVQGAFEANRDALYEAVRMTLSPAGEGLVDGLLARLELESAPRPACYAEIRKALRLLTGSAKPIPAVVIISLERSPPASEIADLMQLAAGFAGKGMKIVMTSDRDAAENILSYAAAASQPLLLRTFFLRRRTLSEGVLCMKARCAMMGAPPRRWTKDALRLAAHIGEVDPEGIVHNALAIAELASMPLVTTWCVVGASAHGERIRGEDDVLAGWRSPPGAWPPADLLATLDELRIEMNGEERLTEEVDQGDADATSGMWAANEPERS